MDIMWGNDNLREHQSREGGGDRRWRFRRATTFIIDYTQANRTVIIITTTIIRVTKIIHRRQRCGDRDDRGCSL